jgi:hypothetical protein
MKTKQYTYNKPSGFYRELYTRRFFCCVPGCCDDTGRRSFALWYEISGPDRDQEMRWLCQDHKEEAAR